MSRRKASETRYWRMEIWDNLCDVQIAGVDDVYDEFLRDLAIGFEQIKRRRDGRRKTESDTQDGA